MSHSKKFFEQAAKIASSIDAEAVERLAVELAGLRARKGRLFFLGVGGSAAGDRLNRNSVQSDQYVTPSARPPSR